MKSVTKIFSERKNRLDFKSYKRYDYANGLFKYVNIYYRSLSVKNKYHRSFWLELFAISRYEMVILYLLTKLKLIFKKSALVILGTSFVLKKTKKKSINS